MSYPARQYLIDCELWPKFKNIHLDRFKTQIFYQLNREFAKENKDFKFYCKKAGIKPTRRQASKYRMKKGEAWNLQRKNNK